MNASDGSAGRARRSPRSQSRGWSYALATLYLLLGALAVARWPLADDHTGRWLAGGQCFLGLGLGIAYLIQAKHRGSGKRPY